jgi:hypothetical protein
VHSHQDEGSADISIKGRDANLRPWRRIRNVGVERARLTASTFRVARRERLPQIAVGRHDPMIVNDQFCPEIPRSGLESIPLVRKTGVDLLGPDNAKLRKAQAGRGDVGLPAHWQIQTTNRQSVAAWRETQMDIVDSAQCRRFNAIDDPLAAFRNVDPERLYAFPARTSTAHARVSPSELHVITWRISAGATPSSVRAVPCILQPPPMLSSNSKVDLSTDGSAAECQRTVRFIAPHRAEYLNELHQFMLSDESGRSPP